MEGKSDLCSLTNEQYFVLRAMYSTMQINDLAIMEGYRVEEIIKKTKYYKQDVKKAWNEYRSDLTKYERYTKRTCILDYLADYCDIVEEYIKPELDEYFFSINRFIKNNAGISDEDSTIMARLVFVMSLYDLSMLRLNDVNKSLKEYVSGTTGKHELMMYDMDRLSTKSIGKRFVSFVDVITKKIKSNNFDINKSDVVCVCFRNLLKKLQDKFVITDSLNKVIGLDIVHQKETRIVGIDKKFNIGRGKFIGRKHSNLKEVKCDYCCLKGKASCNMINCEGMYIEKVS